MCTSDWVKLKASVLKGIFGRWAKDVFCLLQHKSPDVLYPAYLFVVQTCTSMHAYPGKGTPNETILSGRCFYCPCNITYLVGYLSVQALMTPTPGFHACPGFYITEWVFGHTSDCRVQRSKQKDQPRQMIYNTARDKICPPKYNVT